MTPKEKAEELVIKFTEGIGLYIAGTKAAILAVDEIIGALNVPPIQNDSMLWKSQNEYWKKVKEEINKL